METWKVGEGSSVVLVYEQLIYILTDLGFWGEGKLNTMIFMDMCEVFLEACEFARCYTLEFFPKLLHAIS